MEANILLFYPSLSNAHAHTRTNAVSISHAHVGQTLIMPSDPQKKSICFLVMPQKHLLCCCFPCRFLLWQISCTFTEGKGTWGFMGSPKVNTFLLSGLLLSIVHFLLEYFISWIARLDCRFRLSYINLSLEIRDAHLSRWLEGFGLKMTCKSLFLETNCSWMLSLRTKTIIKTDKIGINWLNWLEKKRKHCVSNIAVQLSVLLLFCVIIYCYNAFLPRLLQYSFRNRDCEKLCCRCNRILLQSCWPEQQSVCSNLKMTWCFTWTRGTTW